MLFRRRLLKWQNDGKAGSPRLGICVERNVEERQKREWSMGGTVCGDADF